MQFNQGETLMNTDGNSLKRTTRTFDLAYLPMHPACPKPV